MPNDRVEMNQMTRPPAQAETRARVPYKQVPMLNAYVHDISMDELVRDFDEGLLLTLHVDMAMKLQPDPEFHPIIARFDVITCDSQIMSSATKSLATPRQERGSGSDFFPRFYLHH